MTQYSKKKPAFVKFGLVGNHADYEVSKAYINNSWVYAITHDSQQYSISELAQITGLDNQTIVNRIKKNYCFDQLLSSALTKNQYTILKRREQERQAAHNQPKAWAMHLISKLPVPSKTILGGQ